MKRRFSKSIFFAAVLVVVFFATTLITENSFAVPPFARKYKTSCQMCHSVPGTLNGFGREFKRNGYVMPGNEPTEGGDLMSEQIEELPGFGGLMEVEGKYYLKTESGKTASDSRRTDIVMPEVEFFLAGNTANIGYMVVFLADMADEQLKVEAAHVQFNDVLGPKNAFNVKVGKMLGGIGHIDTFYHFKGFGTITPRKQGGGDNDMIQNGDYKSKFGKIDTFTRNGLGVEINGQFGPVYYGLGLTVGNDGNTEEKDNHDFHKDYYAFVEFKHGNSGGGFWSNDMITARLHFYMGTEDNKDGYEQTTITDRTNQWVKKMRIGATIDFNYGPLITNWTFAHSTAKHDGNGNADKKKYTAISLIGDVGAILLNGKVNPQFRFEYTKGSASGETSTFGTKTVDGVTRKYDSEMYGHLGFSSLLRSNAWAVVGARFFLNASKYNQYNYTAGKGEKLFVEVFEAKVVVAY